MRLLFHGLAGRSHAAAFLLCIVAPRAAFRGGTMIYFYEQGGRFRRCEVRALDDTYELVVVESNGSESVEAFTQYDALIRRIEGLHCDWRLRGWTGPHGRGI